MVRQACPEPAEELTVMVRPDHHEREEISAHPCILIMDVIDRIVLGPQEAEAQQGRHVQPNQSPNSW